MQLNRDLNGLFQCLNQLRSLVRKQQACHILDTDGVCTHLLDVLRHGGPILQCIRVAQGVGQRYLCMAVLFVGSLYCCLQVTQVVQTVEDTDNVDTICDGLLYEVLYDVVAVGTVTQNVLSTEQHLQRSFLCLVFDFAKSLPGILMQETKGCVEGSSSPALQGMVAYLIQFFHDGQHLLCGHTCSNQRLMCVTQDSLGNLYRFHI